MTIPINRGFSSDYTAVEETVSLKTIGTLRNGEVVVSTQRNSDMNILMKQSARTEHFIPLGDVVTFSFVLLLTTLTKRKEKEGPGSH